MSNSFSRPFSGESADPRRFANDKGLFSYQDKSGNQVAIAGSIQTQKDRTHAIGLIAAAAGTVTP